ncbi:biotin-dependent carboxyltransferase family protein [Psychrobacter sp. M13]|uniref:5-oxoprolinase subunit C family protein n=1 Tax=Psychrobacter sp. M13 TaxID=3067275 RepID=UPI00273C7C93|nr:biotin-dependent carboxyltransferase family protein [Psychrobacter sp. M13]WLP93407.1 biotin-dependent carboxyltransferase family protein [Psychrobacter sp. M13]
MKILTTNALASIQDSGRFGYRSMGVGRNGVMDSWSLQAGNALMKNDLNEPAIEIAMGELIVEFEENVSFCLTGALYEAYLDDKRIACYWRINAQAGQTLKLIRPLQGMYTYLCVHGGFDIEPVLQSTSTNLKAGFGGFEGRYLKADDTLKVRAASNLPVIGVARLVPTQTIRVIKNSEYEYFTSDSKAAFESQQWQLQSSSNRMGYRLNGNALEFIEAIQMSSHGVDIGMIQVPPQGQPIVLMADAQTTGGYPKIATVINADIGLMAQIRFGKTCQFAMVTVEQALYEQQNRHYYIEQIKEYAHEN